MTQRTLLPLLLIVFALLAACSDDDIAARDSGTSDVPVDSAMDSAVDALIDGRPDMSDVPDSGVALQWGPCEVSATDPAPGIPTPECATLEVPLRNVEPDGRRIRVAARRLSGPAPRLGDLWYVEGGPGGTGLGMEQDPFVAKLIERGWDVHISVHRGLRGSTELQCPEQSTAESEGAELVVGAEIAACAATLSAEWGDELDAFNAEEQAHDLARLIASTREEGERIVLWGTSYGTYRSLEFLRHYPDGVVDAVLLDSVLDLQSDPWNDMFLGDERARPVMAAACLADPMCADRTAGDPIAFAREALSVLHEQRCAPLREVSRRDFQYTLSNIAGLRIAHGLMFPLLDRIARCTDSGAGEVLAFLSAISTIGEAASVREETTSGDVADVFGSPLYLNVSCRDLHRIVRTEAELDALEAGLVFSRDEARLLNQACPDWPTRRDDERPRELRETETPILIVQGDLDFPTPPQWAERVAATYPSAQLVHIPAAGHSPLDQFGNANSVMSGACLAELAMDFFDDVDVTIPVDACAADVDFAETSAELVTFVLGGSLWEE